MSADVANLVTSTAASYGVDPSLALEVAITESDLNQSAMGSRGEIGVMQLMPGTAAAMGVDPTDITQNVQGGVALLSQLISHFGGDVAKAVAAYNAGQDAVDSAVSRGGAGWFNYIPASTRSYVNGILGALGTQYTATPLPVAVAQEAVSSVQQIATDSPISFWVWGGVLLVGLIFLREALE